jgi:DNA modification methylase
MATAKQELANKKKSAMKAPEFFQTSAGVLYVGDATTVLQTLPDESVDCIIGSPPYFSVRDYGVSGQIGLEKAPQDYLDSLCGVYAEAKRVLKRTGSCWVVIGDLYLDKNLIMLPARFAIAMQAQGWIVRNDVIWRKTRSLPHPVKDRLINTHEHIYHFVKNREYYYDLDSIRVPHAASSLNRVKSKITVSHKGRYGEDEGNRGRTIDALNEKSAVHPNGRNPGDVFDACPSNAADGHLATYPEDLIAPRIRSTCPVGGTVLDFWMGSGTTAIVAEKLNRRWIGIELNRDYCKIAKKKLSKPLQPLLR